LHASIIGVSATSLLEEYSPANHCFIEQIEAARLPLRPLHAEPGKACSFTYFMQEVGRNHPKVLIVAKYEIIETAATD
jgi:hypothetical protein